MRNNFRGEKERTKADRKDKEEIVRKIVGPKLKITLS